MEVLTSATVLLRRWCARVKETSLRATTKIYMDAHTIMWAQAWAPEGGTE